MSFLGKEVTSTTYDTLIALDLTICKAQSQISYENKGE